MKKHIIISALFAAAALCSCVKENLEPSTTGRAFKINFEGDFVAQTKVQFEDAVEGIHSLTWSEGDAIGIFSYSQEETTNDNIQAILHENTIGGLKGLFVPQDEIIQIPSEEEGGEPTEGIIQITYPQVNNETWVVYYPFKKGTAINVEDGCIHSTILANQSQDKLGDRKVCQNGIATAVADVKANSAKATFSMTHRLAYICVKAASSEFSGYQLHGVQMFDKNAQANLIGDYTIEPIEGVVTLKEGTGKPSVRVDVKNHDFSSTPEKSELYLTVLPGDYSSADIYFVVTFVNAAGESKTIPIEFEKSCKFPAGSLTTIDLGNITASMAEKWPWYEVSEKRDLLGLWAYGSQNTYMGMKPWQEVGGATVAASEITIDVKPRGDFFKVREPKYYAILVSCEMGDAGKGNYGRKFLSVDGTSTTASMATPVNVNNTGFATLGSYYPINSDYTFKIYVLPTSDRWKDDAHSNRDGKDGRWGVVAIFDENKELIWSYMINGYDEDDAPKAVQYPEGFALMDRFLGVGNGNDKAVREGWFDANAPAYFQWGRKDPLNYSSSGGLEILMACRTTPVDEIGDAAAIPTTRISTAGDPWYKGPVRDDLWGGVNNTDDWYDANAKGRKTIYDPCPEGYRVPDAYVFKVLNDNAEIWEFNSSLSSKLPMQVTDSSSPEYRIKADSPWAAALSFENNRNHSVFAYPIGAGQYDYWPYLGYIGNSGSTYTSGRSSSTHYHALNAWSNSMAKTYGRAVCLEYAYFSKAIERRTDMRMTNGYPVRCQKED